MTPDELLRSLRLPVVAAPMFLVSGPELVVAAAGAGILGAFPTQNCRTPEQLDEWLGVIASGAGTAPWAVNLITHRSNSRLADDLALVAAHRPPVVITALGSPRPVMDAVKGYGGLVVADVIDHAHLGHVDELVVTGTGLRRRRHGTAHHRGTYSGFSYGNYETAPADSRAFCDQPEQPTDRGYGKRRARE